MMKLPAYNCPNPGRPLRGSDRIIRLAVPVLHSARRIARQRKMQSEVNWRALARLCRRRGFMAQGAVQVGRGDLAEMVALALRQPEEQQRDLFVSCETIRRELPWSHIRKLASREDFPLFI